MHAWGVRVVACGGDGGGGGSGEDDIGWRGS